MHAEQNEPKVGKVFGAALKAVGPGIFGLVATTITGKWPSALWIIAGTYVAFLVMYRLWECFRNKRAKADEMAQENKRLSALVSELRSNDRLNTPSPGIMARALSGFLRCLETGEAVKSKNELFRDRRQYTVMDYRIGNDGFLYLTSHVKPLQGFENSDLKLLEFTILDGTGTAIGQARPVELLESGRIKMLVSLCEPSYDVEVRQSCGQPGNTSEWFNHYVEATAPAVTYKISSTKRRELISITKRLLATLEEALSDGCESKDHQNT